MSVVYSTIRNQSLVGAEVLYQGAVTFGHRVSEIISGSGATLPPNAPEGDTGLAEPTTPSVRLRLKTGNRELEMSDAPTDPCMNLREWQDSIIHAYERTDHEDIVASLANMPVSLSAILFGSD